MGIAQWAGVLDTVGGLVQIARRFRQNTSSGSLEPFDGAQGKSLDGAQGRPPSSIGGLGFLEARLANVLVAALKEAFDRDSARLEMERSQIDAERQRAEEALRAELRRQAADRMLGQLRLVAIMAILTWALSAALGVWMPGMRENLPRILLGIGWLFALGALGSSLSAWQHVSMRAADTSVGVVLEHPASAYAPWLLITSLALTGAGLLTAL
jgi:hypothetical protein